MADKPMNPRHKAFCEEYVKDHNGRLAYTRAGYKPLKEGAIDAAASRLLKNVKVAAYIQRLEAKATKNRRMSVDDILTGIEGIAKDEMESTGHRIAAYKELLNHHDRAAAAPPPPNLHIHAEVKKLSPQEMLKEYQRIIGGG